MVPRPQGSYDVSVYLEDGGDLMRGRLTASSAAAASEMVENYHTHGEQRINNKHRSVPERSIRRSRVKFTPLAVVFFIGFVATASLNFFHVHRLESSLTGGGGDSSSFPNLPKPIRGMGAESRVWSPAKNDPKSIDVKQEVSACLIVMDDNHFLIEWLAYHYMHANLRHLIVTSDPTAKTSPLKVLDRWKDRINIEVWNETRFIPKDYERQVAKKSYNNTKLTKLNFHRVRQATFNMECLREFKRQDRGWTMVIDADEYIMPRNSEESNEIITKGSNTTALRKQTAAPTISDVLSTFHIPAGFEKVYSPCLAINRLQFSAKESPVEKVQAMVAPRFDGMDFQTLRWRHLGFTMEWYKSQFGKTCGKARDIPNKVIIDLSRLTLEEIMDKKNEGNPHKPLKVCPENVYANLRETPFVLHHYMGTPKQWFYRSNDKRGIGYRKARYEDMNLMFGVNESDTIRPWLGDFVAAVGNDEAHRLLKDVGKVEPLPGNAETPERKLNDASENLYSVGEIVEVDFAGEGNWYEAEIYAAYSDNYYSVFFDDCTQEIATWASRMRIPKDDDDDDKYTDVPTMQIDDLGKKEDDAGKGDDLETEGDNTGKEDDSEMEVDDAGKEDDSETEVDDAGTEVTIEEKNDKGKTN